MKNTEFIQLTEMWQNGDYLDVAKTIKTEDWGNATLAEFCSYFVKYLGIRELNLLYKFL
jgi:hypothetical protein